MVHLPPVASGEETSNEGAPINQGGVTVTTGSSYQMPDVFTVTVKAGKEEKEVLVRLERPKLKKPFLGGYKHKVSGLEYHHAAAQTMPRRREDNGVRHMIRNG